MLFPPRGGVRLPTRKCREGFNKLVNKFHIPCNNPIPIPSNMINSFIMKNIRIFKRTAKTDKPKKSKGREWLDAFIFAIVAATIIRGLLFSAYAIPSGSMEGTEQIGRAHV